MYTVHKEFHCPEWGWCMSVDRNVQYTVGLLHTASGDTPLTITALKTQMHMDNTM